jgi:hypothetical protein
LTPVLEADRTGVGDPGYICVTISATAGDIDIRPPWLALRASP